jgi:hypothetical protein
MQSTFAVFADQNRRILDELCQGERSVGERVDKPHRRYRLRPKRLVEIDAWLAPYRRFWAGRLDALRAHLDQEQV